MTRGFDWIIVANPNSGRYGAIHHGRMVDQYLTSKGFTSLILESTSNSDFKDSFSSLLQEGRPRGGVIVLGGDGTVHQTANIIHQIDSSIPFGVIPMGTGNDFAMQCGLLTIDPAKLMEMYTTDAPVDIDVIKVDQRICLQIMSSGFDARVSERSRTLPTFLKNLRYVLALFIELGRFEVLRYELEIDGRKDSRHAMMVSCANGRNYGGGMLLSPHSDHQDGILELVVLHPVSRVELLKVFPRIFSGSHIFHPAFEVIPFRNLHLRADTISQGDGEDMFSQPIDLSISASTVKTWKI